MGHEEVEVETVLPAGLIPNPNYVKTESDAQVDDFVVISPAAAGALECESEPEDAGSGRKLRKRTPRTKRRGRRGDGSGGDNTPKGDAGARSGRKSLISRWRSSRSKSRGRSGGTKSKSRLSFRGIHKADSNATEKVANTSKAKEESKGAGKKIQPTKEGAGAAAADGESVASGAIGNALSAVREGNGSPDNTAGTASLAGDSPGAGGGDDRKDAAVTGVGDISIEVGDDDEHFAIAVESPFGNKPDDELKTALSTGSAKSARSTRSEASVNVAAKSSDSVRSTRSNKSLSSCTDSNQLVKANDSKEKGEEPQMGLVVSGSKEVEITASASTASAGNRGEGVENNPSVQGKNDGEAAAIADKQNKDKGKWVKKVSVSIGGYKTSFQFTDPMSNLANAVNDALDVVGNDNNLVEQAQRLDDDDISTNTADGVDEGPEEERDYDEDPTQLFMNLQQRNWGLSLARLQTHPAEARIWVYRKARPEKAPDIPDASKHPAALVVQHTSLVAHNETEPPKFRWKLLPLHAAIVLGAPTEIIQDMIRAYPRAARKTDERGSLPVHLAASRLDVDPEGEKVVLQLFGAYPDSIEVPDRKGRTPPELAKLARARKEIEEQRRITTASSVVSQMGVECTASQCEGMVTEDRDECDGKQYGSGDYDNNEEGGEGDGEGGDDDDDEVSVKSGISGRFMQMLRKSKSTDTVDRRKKKKKKKKDKDKCDEKRSLDDMDSHDEVADDRAIAESLGPGFAFLKTSKTQEVRELAASDDEEKVDEDDELTESELLKSVKQAMIGKEYQMPTNAPAKPNDGLLSLPLPMSFCDDGSVRSGKSLSPSTMPLAGEGVAISRTTSSDSASKSKRTAISCTSSGDSVSRSKGLAISRTSSADSASKASTSNRLAISNTAGSTSASKSTSPKKGMTITKDKNEILEIEREALHDAAASTGVDIIPSPKRKVNEGLRALLEKASENAGRSGVDVTMFVDKLEDEWVTDVEALRRLDCETLDDLLPLMLSRELQRLINHADSIDVKFLEAERLAPTNSGSGSTPRGRSPKKSSKKKKKKRSHRRVKKRGHYRPVSRPEGPLTPISETEEDHHSPNFAGSDCQLSIRTEARSAYSAGSALSNIQVPDEEDEECEEGAIDEDQLIDEDQAIDEELNEEANCNDDIVQSASIEDLEIRKLHAHLIADARKKFPTREALENSIAERQAEVEAAVDSGFDVDKQTLARAALADDEVRKLLPL